MLTQNNGQAINWQTLDEKIIALIKERDILLEFVRKISNQGCDLISEECLACDALDVLRKIGKENERI